MYKTEQLFPNMYTIGKSSIVASAFKQRCSCCTGLLESTHHSVLL